MTAAPTNETGEIHLSWLAPLSNGGSLTDYVIQRSPNGSTGWTTIGDGVNTFTGYTVTGLTNGTRYYFRVFAANGAGTSPASNIANSVPRAAPSGPRSLTAAPTNLSGQVRLTWVVPLSTGGSAITDYVVQRSPNGSTGWVTVNDGFDTETAYTVTGLTNGTRYYFRVSARNAAGTGPASTLANSIPRHVLTAPRSLTAAPTNLSGQVRVSWVAPLSNGGHPITDYIIQRSPNGSTGWVTITDGVGTATSRTVAGLSNATRYHFRVFARTGGLTGPGSNVVSAIPRETERAGRARGVRHLPGLLGRLDRADGKRRGDHGLRDPGHERGGSVGDVPRRRLDGDGHLPQDPRLQVQGHPGRRGERGRRRGVQHRHQSLLPRAARPSRPGAPRDQVGRSSSARTSPASSIVAWVIGSSTSWRCDAPAVASAARWPAMSAGAPCTGSGKSRV